MSPTFAKSIANLSRANAQTSVPVDLTQNQRTRETELLMLRVNRLRDGTTGALDGTVGIFGAKLPEATRPDSGHVLSAVTDPGTGVAFTFDTNIAYAAFSNYNWVVKVAGVVIGYKAAPDAANLFKVTDNSGKARITIGDTTHQPAEGATLEIYKVTPVEILADGANEVVDTEILAPSLMWAVTTGTPASATVARVESRA